MASSDEMCITHDTCFMEECCIQLRTVDDIDSALVCRMAERVAEGKLSVSGAAACASDFVQDGSVKAGP